MTRTTGQKTMANSAGDTGDGAPPGDAGTGTGRGTGAGRGADGTCLGEAIRGMRALMARTGGMADLRALRAAALALLAAAEGAMPHLTGPEAPAAGTPDEGDGPGDRGENPRAGDDPRAGGGPRAAGG